MAASCPNINSPEWKALVAEHGESKSLRMFGDNNYTIPKVNSRVGMNPRPNGLGYFLNQSAVREALENNPKIAKEILDDLAKKFPHVRVANEAMFDEDVKWNEFPPGHRGMHYRNALISAIAYSNDATLDTIPHEYAHEYIQMFADTKLVKEALAKHGEEALAQQAGELYAKKKTTGWFGNFMDDLMYSVRKVFGNPSVSEKLARAFYKNKKLGQETYSRSGYRSDQKNTGPKNYMARPTGAGFKADDKIYNQEAAEDYVITEKKLKDAYKKKILPSFMKDGTLDVEAFSNHVKGNLKMAKTVKLDGTRSRNNPDGNPQGYDSDAVLQMEEYFSGLDGMTANPITLNNLARWLSGEQTQFTTEEIKQFNQFQRMHQAIGIYFKDYALGAKPMKGYVGYQTTISNKIFTSEGMMTDLDSVVGQVHSEFRKRMDHKGEFAQKLKKKLPWANTILDKLNLSGIVASLFDAHLLAFSLTGKNNSEFSKLFDQSLNHGVNEDARIENAIVETTSKGNQIKDYKRWGRSDIRDGNIDDYKTVTITDVKGAEIKLTMAEAATLYLNMAQEDTLKALTDKGMYLNDAITGRSTSITKVIKPQLQSLREIKELFENNPENKLFVEMVRDSMDMLYNEVNPIFVQLYGSQLENRANHFPAFYGQANSGIRTAKNQIDEFMSIHERMGGDKPVRIGDAKMIFNNYAQSAKMYAAYSLPIRNNRMVLRSLKPGFAHDKRMMKRIDMAQGFLNRLEDPSLLYSSQGESETTQKINQFMSNFAVFVLGYNQFVVVKQTASFMAAQEYIPIKHLQAAGQGFGKFAIPKLGKFFKALKSVDKSQDLDSLRKILPVEYRMDETNESYQEIMKHSDYLTHRFRGHSHRELSEALMDRFKGQDMIELKIPGFKNPLKISKTRAMEGIRVMDAVTVMDIWKATKLWANEQIELGEIDVEKDSPEYWEHVGMKAEEAIKRTQPVSDVVNRSHLSSNKDVLSRTITQFTSATQQIGKLVIKRIMEYQANPSAENKKKLASTMFRTMFMTAVYITAIDLIKSMMMYGFDDPKEDIPKFVVGNTVNNMAGYFQGFGVLIRQVSSRIDDQPWTASMQHPIETMIDDASDAVAHTIKGDFGKATREALELLMQGKGIPINPLKTTEKIVQRFQ